MPGEGLVYHDIEWTPMGLRVWKRKLFQDISLAVFRRADGTVIALHSAALCRHCEIDVLTISGAAAGPQLAPLFGALGLSLAGDADEAGVAMALKKATAKIETAKKSPDAMSADLQAIDGHITTLSTEVKNLQGARRAQMQ